MKKRGREEKEHNGGKSTKGIRNASRGKKIIGKGPGKNFGWGIRKNVDKDVYGKRLKGGERDQQGKNSGLTS